MFVLVSGLSDSCSDQAAGLDSSLFTTSGKFETTSITISFWQDTKSCRNLKKTKHADHLWDNKDGVQRGTYYLSHMSV